MKKFRTSEELRIFLGNECIRNFGSKYSPEYWEYEEKIWAANAHLSKLDFSYALEGVRESMGLRVHDSNEALSSYLAYVWKRWLGAGGDVLTYLLFEDLAKEYQSIYAKKDTSEKDVSGVKGKINSAVQKLSMFGDPVKETVMESIGSVKNRLPGGRALSVVDSAEFNNYGPFDTKPEVGMDMNVVKSSAEEFIKYRDKMMQIEEFGSAIDMWQRLLFVIMKFCEDDASERMYWAYKRQILNKNASLLS